MVRQTHRSAPPDGKRHGYSDGHVRDPITHVQIIQYRSYQRDIFIYHVRQHLLSLPVIRRALQSQEEYRDRLTSFDPIRYFPVVEGDEVPSGCIEAAYMPSNFHGHGSVLALRTDIEAGKVEWFIFSGPIHDTFLAQIMFFGDNWNLQPGINPDDHRKVFNLVGYAKKGLKTRTVKGANAEHKSWHDSLCAAEKAKENLRLTWKGYGNELRVNQERRRTEQIGYTADEQMDGKDDHLMRPAASAPPQRPQKPFVRRKA